MRTADVGGARIAYRVDGPDDAAPAVVLLNSLGTDHRMWDAQAEALARRFRVVRYDVRGHGASAASAEPVTIERLGLDVVALLDHLGLARAHLCGLSLGGITALWVAARRPERVARAVFANTAARIGSAEGWSGRIAAVRGGGMAAVRDAALRRFLGDRFRAAHPEETRRIGAMLDATPPEGYVAACAALRDADLRGEVPAIRAPSLVIAGGIDESTPPHEAEALHAAIPGSALVVLDGAAHLTNVERPAEFTALVSGFLAR